MATSGRTVLVVMIQLLVAATAAAQGAAGTPAGAKPAMALPAQATMAKPGPGKMQHCPSAVAGAVTKVKNTRDGVEVTVTAKEPAAVAEIRTRATHLAEVSAKGSTSGRHTSGGDFGGGVGQCPVVLKHTVVTSKEVAGGARLSVRLDVAGLQRMVKERVEQLAAGPSGPAPAGGAPR